MAQKRIFVGFGSTPKEAFLDAYAVAEKKMAKEAFAGLGWVVDECYCMTVGPEQAMNIVCNLQIRYGAA